MFSGKQGKSYAAVKASYVVSEMMAMTEKPFKDSKLFKPCMLQAANIVCPKPKGHFSNISFSASTVAEHISDMSRNIHNQLCEKTTHFHSVAPDERTDSRQCRAPSICPVVLMTIIM